jgi:hypothetical protein
MNELLPAATAAIVAALALNATRVAYTRKRTWLTLAFLTLVLVLKAVFSRGDLVPVWLQMARDLAVAFVVLSSMPTRKIKKRGGI